MAGEDAATKAFEPEDIFHHRVLAGLDGGTGHDRIAFKVTRALEKADDYETVVWSQELGRQHRPVAMTSAAHGAGSPKLDREGATLAFLSQRGKDGRQVHLLRTDGGEARKLTHASDQTLSSIEGWSADGRRLLACASVKWREDGEKDPKPGQRPPQVARYLPYKRDGAGIIVGERTHLFAINADHGGISQLTEGDFDVDSGAWSPDGRRLLYLRNRGGRQRHRSDVWVADADGRDARCLVKRLASPSHAAWSPDGRWIAMAAVEVEGASQYGLWLVDATSGDARQLGGEDFEVEPTAGGVCWHADGDRLAVVCAHRGLRVLVVVSIPDGRVTLHRKGLRSLQGLCNAGDRLAFIATGMRRLDEVHSLDWSGGDEQRHSAFNRRWFAARRRPQVAKRRFHVPDGKGGEEIIDAWLLRPEGEGPFPLLVDFHGGPHSMVLSDFSAHTYWYLLLSRGWMVLAANAVGSGGRGRLFAERLRANWGELDLPQHVAIIRALQAEGLADTRIACAGKSYGGFMCAWAIGHTDLFKAAMVAAPVANIESHSGTSDTGYYVTPHAMDGEFHQTRERYHRLSPIGYCHNVSAATLILQGENDGRCPRGQSEELFANLIRCTDAPVELVVYPESSHSEAESGRPSNRVDYHRRLAGWAERWTKRG